MINDTVIYKYYSILHNYFFNYVMFLWRKYTYFNLLYTVLNIVVIITLNQYRGAALNIDSTFLQKTLNQRYFSIYLLLVLTLIQCHCNIESMSLWHWMNVILTLNHCYISIYLLLVLTLILPLSLPPSPLATPSLSPSPSPWGGSCGSMWTL